MILVLLGTFYIEFDRPLKLIEEQIVNGFINEPVIVQNGHTKFQSNNLVLKPFIDPEELTQLYNEASLIITHAGTGSIMKGLKADKKVITVPRLAKYNEHIDDHQLEIHKLFASLGYTFPWNEEDSLQQVLKDVLNFTPNKYVSNKHEIISYLKTYIETI